jgi:hypothetical protein
MDQRYIVTGQFLRQDEKFIYTTAGIFNKKWYRLPLVEVKSYGTS